MAGSLRGAARCLGPFEGVTVLSVSCSGLATSKLLEEPGDRGRATHHFKGRQGGAPSCVPRRSELPSLVAPPVRPQRPLPVLAGQTVALGAPFALESWCAPGANRW